MIKTSELYKKVIEIATKNPDTIYDDRVKQIHGVVPDGNCQYIINGEPACLVGVAMSELGISSSDLASFDHIGGILAVISEYKDNIFELDGNIFDLKDIQRRQDDGTCWGKAIEG